MSAKTSIIDYVAGHDISKVTNIDQLPVYVNEFMKAEMMRSFMEFSFSAGGAILLLLIACLCLRAVVQKTKFGCWEDGFPAFLIGLFSLLAMVPLAINAFQSNDWIFISNTPINYLMNL